MLSCVVFLPFLHERCDSVCCLARTKDIFSSPHLVSSAVFMFIILNWHRTSTVGQFYFRPVQSVCLFICVCLEQLSPQKAREAAAMFLITYSPWRTPHYVSLKTLAPETDWLTLTLLQTTWLLDSPNLSRIARREKIHMMEYGRIL